MANFVYPSAVDAERTVLGCMLLDSGNAATALGILDEDSFSDADPRNRLVFRAMVELYHQKTQIDPTSVGSTLTTLHLYEEAGGNDYLKELLDYPVSLDNIEHYIKIVQDNAVLTRYLKSAQALLADYARDGVADIGEFLGARTLELQRIAEGRSVGDFETAAQVATQVDAQIALLAKQQNSKNLTGVDTGYTRLNNLTHGWQQGDLIILAARPSIGKTAFALNLAYNGASYSNKPVAVFSLEMSSEQVMKRLISSVSGVPTTKIMVGNLNRDDKLKINRAVNEISNTKLYFDDTPNGRLGDILAKARKLKKAQPDLCLIVIDYLTLIKPETKSNSTAEDIGTITSALKELARSIKIPVICLAQLNRDVEDNVGGKPKLSNLKGSGNIEQDADIVMLMHRPDYYKQTGQSKDAEDGLKKSSSFGQVISAQLEANKANSNGADNVISMVEIIVAKNRNGQIGDTTLYFNKETSRFDNPSQDFENRKQMVASGKRVDSVGIE